MFSCYYSCASRSCLASTTADSSPGAYSTYYSESDSELSLELELVLELEELYSDDDELKAKL